MARGLQLVFLLLVCALYVEAKSVTCEKKYSKKVTIKDGDSYTYATQSGTNYESKSKCKITYKKHKSCSAMKFSCSAFAIDSPKSNCKGGDKMVVSTSEAKNKKYCQTSGPDVTTTGKSIKVTFTSNGKAQDTGAVCTVECVSDEVTTQAPTEEPTTGSPFREKQELIFSDLLTVWNLFRDPQNGFWCDTISFPAAGSDVVPCGAQNNFYSSAGTGMGLVSEAISVELGYSTREAAEARLVHSLNSIILNWPMETFSGFLTHFTNRNFEQLAEFSTIDTSILVLGALFAGNYFEGEVLQLALQLRERTTWSDAIKGPDPEGNLKPRIYGRINKLTGEGRGNILPFNEYYLVAYMANMTSPAGTNANLAFEKFWSSEGAPEGNGDEWRPQPAPVNYQGYDLLSDGTTHFVSSFAPLFNFYLAKGYQANTYYTQMNHRWMQADQKFWSLAIPEDGQIWGTPVKGRVWGAGAGPAISGYGVEKINDSKDLIISAAIMAGFLHAANTTEKQTINDQLIWLYDNDICAYPVQLSEEAVAPKILWRCSIRVPDWRCYSVDTIDFSTMVLGYATNFLPEDFYMKYAA